MVTQVIGTCTPRAQAFRRDRSVAVSLVPAQRKNLSVEVLARTQPVSHVAARFGVSRKFAYLDLLQFFLNHRRYIRSDRLERIGKSLAELLNSRAHPHWLELLGFERFGLAHHRRFGQN